jgi:hypothetical protein
MDTEMAPPPPAYAASLYALVTELKRSRSPIMSSQLRGSCVHQIKEVFESVPAEERPDALKCLVTLLLDHIPDTPPFELVVVNLLEDLCAKLQLLRQGRSAALRTAQEHSSTLAPSLCFSLSNPLYEMMLPQSR